MSRYEDRHIRGNVLAQMGRRGQHALSPARPSGATRARQPDVCPAGRPGHLRVDADRGAAQFPVPVLP
jgi:hypothetical protein